MKLARIFISGLLLIGAGVCQAVGAEGADTPPRWDVSLRGGLYVNNEQAWLLRPAVGYSFNDYVGVSLGVEFTSQYNQPSRFTQIDGYEAELLRSERDVGWMVFKPSVVFRSPRISLSRDGFYRLWFEAAPGVSLACPFRNSLTYELKEFQGGVSQVFDVRRFPNEHLTWVYWNVSLSAKVAIDRFTVGLGYEFSNFDYYSCRRNVTLASGEKFAVPSKQMSQAVFVTIGYAFF